MLAYAWRCAAERGNTKASIASVASERYATTSCGEGVHYGIASSGALVYVPDSGSNSEDSIVWVDREGRTEALPIPRGNYEEPRLSPEGDRLALHVKPDIWIYDVSRGTKIRLTRGEADDFEPVWTPNGERVTFSSYRNGAANLYWQRSDGSGEAEQLSVSEFDQFPTSWSPDGQVLLFAGFNGDKGLDVWSLGLGEDRRPEPLLANPYDEWTPKFSPDGCWLAYVSGESGRREVFVRPYPDLDPKIPISTEGGVEPVWNPAKPELFYRSDDRLMCVTYTTDDGFRPTRTEVLFEGTFKLSAPGFPNYDVSADGEKFAMIETSETGTPSTQIHLVLNWLDELKRLSTAD